MNDSKSDLKRHRCCFTGHRPEKLGISEGDPVQMYEVEFDYIK